ncbi:MAG: hypothetical protein AMJ37_03535, partial [Dehalococcoidia bacterium DG_18]
MFWVSIKYSQSYKLVLESEAMSTALGVTVCGDREFRWGERTFIMGVLNLTPDSFSGDGLGSDIAAALARARRLVSEGADILDVG